MRLHCAGVWLLLSAAICMGQDSSSLKKEIQAALEAASANRLEDAAAGFAAVIAKAPGLAEAHMNLGIVRHRQGRLTAAVEEFETALQLKPDLKGAHAVLGFDDLQIVRVSKAVSELEQAVQEDPSNAKVNGWLGMAYVAAGSFRAAVPRLEMALQAQPQDVPLLGALARAYSGAMGQVHQRLAELGKTSAEAHVALAQSYAAAGLGDAAIDEYIAALALDPKLTGVQGPLGDIYMDASKLDEAEAAYRKDAEEFPDAPETLFRLGLVLTQQGKPVEAQPFLRKAVEGDPGAGEPRVYLGKALLDLGKLEEAETTLRGALELPLPAKFLRTAHYSLALVCRRLGKAAEASKEMEAFHKLEAAEQK